VTTPEFDLVVFGATGFAGRLVSRHLSERRDLAPTFKWAVAGRSKSKLAALRTSLGSGSSVPGAIVADAHDPRSLNSLCSRTRVVITTVGPYALYGDRLVAACVANGTDYCDLSAEFSWIRRMIDRHQGEAERTGARLVHCCGFDSIPSDLGGYVLQSLAKKRFGSPCRRIKMRVKRLRGGISGGTFASMLNLFEEAAADPGLRTELKDPYSLCPPARRPKNTPRAASFPAFDADFDAWTSPFIMAAINTRIVHRTNALLGHAYGAEFLYDEASLTGRGWRGRMKALRATGLLAGFVRAASRPATRRWLEKWGPEPGTGPDAEKRSRGCFDLRFLGQTADGNRLQLSVAGDEDPGYGSTGRMLAEAGLEMIASRCEGTGPGGFFTPASLFGDALVPPLERHAGLRFEPEDAR